MHEVWCADEGASDGACSHGGAYQAGGAVGDLAAVQDAVETGISAGFQLATGAGPLCDEPMWGVAFEVRLLCSLLTSGYCLSACLPGCGGEAVG